MLVSFVVIAFNEERNIAGTLEAVLAQRADGPDGRPVDLEVIVVDDGSGDRTAEIAARVLDGVPRTRVLTGPNAGRGAARARGVASATGEVIAGVDGDILLPPHWLARTLVELRGVDAVGGVPVPDGDVALVHRLFGLVPTPRPAAATVTGSNGLFRRSVFDRVGYDPRYRNGEDVGLVAAMAAEGFSMRTLADLLVVHREHKSVVDSIRWLHESGRGAARQQFVQSTVRLPDLIALGFWGLVGAGGALTVVGMPWWIVLGGVGAFTVAASAALLNQRFALARTPVRSGGAVLVQAGLLVSYFVGRLVGLPAAVAWRWREARPGPLGRRSGPPSAAPLLSAREDA